ncbi:polyhydroxyalkanoate depolymerase [Burkholderiaceae bacterium FT117]|uniref:polyhydroxyalkanoate depolymerase n=1 Tax=Zeimonas sediminis TaxID=2944268 RepID=UPI002342DBCE|nr:polyhydroxyalkanoate depolymerase [Zeimonas sediminis]MCM5572171.1 polyhydroxyalkanoate depolymerase [Zeimonas sediminis]
MLYQIREAQRAVLKPLSSWADSMSLLYGDPYSPMAMFPFSNRISAGFELLYRLGKDYEKPEFGLSATRIDDTEVPIVERVEMNFPFCRLLKFERLLPKSLAHRSTDPAVLVFAPLSGHHATLLRDTVRALLPDHNVYITDWVDARMVSTWHGPFHLDDYIGYAIRFIRHLGPEVHVLSVCQPTVPVMAAVSLMASMKDPHQPRTMTMMGGPIDTRSSPTKVNDLAMTRSHDWFERMLIHRVPSRYPGAGRRVYPGFLQHAGFVAMNPDRHMTSHWDFYLDLVRGDMDDAESHRRFYDEYNAVLDMPAEYYLDTIRLVFQEHALPLGTWDVEFEGKTWRVNPADITDVALFTIEGELDDISGLGQTEAAQGLCSGIPKKNKQHFVVPGAGHYGIFSGRRWREMVCPEVRAFIQQHRRDGGQLKLVG